MKGKAKALKTRLTAKIAAVLTAVATLGAGGLMASSAWADDAGNASDQGTITINEPKAVDGDNMIAPTVDGRSFTAYELGSYSNVQTSGDDITGFDLTNANGLSNDTIRGWIKEAAISGGKVDSQYAGVLNADGTFIGAAENLTPLEFVVKYFYGTKADRYGNEQADNTAMRLFAQAAAKAGITNGVTVEGANNQVEFINLPEGLYLIVENAPSGSSGSSDSSNQTIARAMITGTTYTDGGQTYSTVKNGDATYTLGQLNLKAEKVLIKKTVSAGDQLATVGSTRSFTISTNVPMYSDYVNWTDPKFAVSDSPSANLTVDDSTIVVAANGKTLTAGTDYTLTTGTPANGFTVALNPTALSGQPLTVTYSATVNSVVADAVTNSATVDFSNDPSTTNTVSKKTENTNIYTAQVPLAKIAFNDANTLLQGAQFSVTQGDGKTPVTFDFDADSDTYSIDPKGTVNTLTVDKAQSVNIAGLAADTNSPVTYTFTETKAPAGYVLGESPVTFTLTVTPNANATTKALKSVGFTVSSADFTNFIDLSGNAVRNGTAVTTASLADGATKLVGGTIRVENTKNASDFAETGGQITRVLIAVAVLAAIGAIFIVVARMRRNSVRQ